MHTSSLSNRLISLDVFRGATIAAMILVNNPGSLETVYSPLQHAEWHGWTFADWIFPFFLFIIGVAMTYSFASRKRRGASSSELLRHSFRRAVILFVLGMVVNGFPFGLFPWHEFSLGTWRIPGVLQRIALCYLAASAIYLKAPSRGPILWAVGLLAGYWLLLKIVPVPGYGSGILEPAGSLVWFIDSKLLPGHTWIFAPVPGFDPEGILSTIPAIVSVLIGILTGQWLRSAHNPEIKTAWMFVAGQGLLLVGWFLALWMPINKNLWTST